MRTGTAAYWVPITVESIDGEPHHYEGYTTLKTHEGVDELCSETLEWFRDIYGAVVDAHYIVDNVEVAYDKDEYHLHLSIVVTGFFNSEMDFEQHVYSDWGMDLAEAFKQNIDKVSMDGIRGYDLNPLFEDPEWSKYNQ